MLVSRAKLLTLRVQKNFSSKFFHNIVEQYERGLYKDMFPANASNEMAQILKSPQFIYAGFDPTADSLHVGNLIILVGLLHWQRNGHHVLAVVGSATASVGDPSGRSDPRVSLGSGLVQDNARGLRENIQRVFDNHRNHVWNGRRPLGTFTLLDNSQWLTEVSAADFVGTCRHLRLGALMSRDSVRARLDSSEGLSLAELCYQAVQAYDWLHLFRTYGCRFQLGGADQMGNITTGHELLSRVEDQKVYGLTMPLVTSEFGDKLGKSAGNAVWLSPHRSSPFELYQFLVRRPDSEVDRLLRQLTFEPEAEVKMLCRSGAGVAQRQLAARVTLLVHGPRGLAEAQATTRALYGGSIEALAALPAAGVAAALPGATRRRLPLSASRSVMELALEAGAFVSEMDARRIIVAGGLSINHKRVTNPEELLTRPVHILSNNMSLLRVGKRNYYVIEWIS